MVVSDQRVIGRPMPRADAPAKLNGQERFAGDLALAGLLHARPVLSTHAHARLVGVQSEAARAVPGVVTILTAADLPFAQGGPPRAAESLAREEIVYAGQPVALVLAESEGAAAEAAALVEVQYEDLPVVLDLVAAMDPGSPLARSLTKMGEDAAEAAMHGVGGGGAAEEAPQEKLSANVSGQTHLEMGDVATGFAAADVVAEGTYDTAWVHQGYIETQTCVAAPDGMGGVTIHASTQGLFRTRQVVAQTLGLAQEQVRVVAMPVGGGFGGKFGLIEPLTAAAALVARRPVRLGFTRGEDLLAANPTPAGRLEVKIGARRDGKVTAIQARLIFDTGAYPNSPMAGAAFAVAGCYHFPNLDIKGFEVMTNRLGPGAYRAPGNPQASFAVESVMDDLAGRLELDPIAFRLLNVPSEGDPRPDGKAWPIIGLKDCLERLSVHPLWQRRAARGATNGGRFREGIGVGVGGWRGGLEPAAALCHVDPSGIVNVVVGAVDLSGTFTTFRMIAAETLGVDYELVRVVGSDSTNAPYSGGSGGSKIVYTVGQAVQRAATDAREQILELAGQILEAAPQDLEIAGDRVRVKGMPAESDYEVTIAKIASLTSGFGAKHAPIAGRGTGAQTANAPGFSAHLARVRVDLDTGEVTLLDYVASQDVGRALNPAAVEGQIIGAVVQGIGWGLYEQLVHDENGQVVTGSLMDYALPRAEVVPHVETVLVEVPSPDGPFGARGVGEPPVIPVAAAIANAIHDATGVRPGAIPITPERLWKQIAAG
ncbi:MAG: Xanthine dehydrogenase, molybdenum binding subunit [uncultured Thermomicrobiales bacterium]|uniref:Xanthine dehydrogenase, molybdenum binding subunit n=1 Tax=uncultured Thermomicrobiales bacterium TaxID=1645740 RepID=A0A6J4UPS9_9BACT|nr:MAG: Xanthine dehydrogenase, molybdenum binding subunit [uncultured Thermomicrobiales bacterium]